MFPEMTANQEVVYLKVHLEPMWIRHPYTITWYFEIVSL